MDKKRREIVTLMKIINIAVTAGIFALIWHYFYSPVFRDMFYWRAEPFVILLFVMLYVSLGHIYNEVHITEEEIREIFYSQILSIFWSNLILFMIAWLLGKHCPVWSGLFLGLGSQIGASVIWNIVMKRIYRRIWQRKRTAVLYYEMRDCEYLEKIESDAKQFWVEKWVYVPGKAEEILSEIEKMDVIFVRGIPADERNTILKYCMLHGIEIYMYPKLGDVLTGAADQISMFHVPVMHLQGYMPSALYRCLKRLMDIVFSLFGIVILSPVLLIIAVIVKWYDGGSVFYRQERLTQNEKHFWIYKFRSMRMDSEKDGVARLAEEGDMRITPVGRVLRRTHMDELPQLFNILKGDMSFVGPRPERPEIAAEYMDELPEFALRLQVKAGLTGYAQVYGKYNSNPYDKLQMDLMYMGHQSVFSDIKILFATVKILFARENMQGVKKGQLTAEREKKKEWEDIRRREKGIEQKTG